MADKVTLFRVSNANYRKKMYLAHSKGEAIQFALMDGHLRDQKNAWLVEEGVNVVAGTDRKFASAIQRAVDVGATGPVTNSNGIALVYSQVFLPLSSV